MSSRHTQAISIADAKRTFADLIGAVRHRRERFVLERRGTPVAALVPLEDLEQLEKNVGAGFLGLVGAFADAPEYADQLDEVVRDRAAQGNREAPDMDP